MSWQDTYDRDTGGASLADQITVLKGVNNNISQLIQAITSTFPRITGSFTLAAAATTTVTQPAIQANSKVFCFATNAAAGTLMGGTKSLYHSANTPGASFAVATASGVAAAGTETFNYFVISPA